MFLRLNGHKFQMDAHEAHRFLIGLMENNQCNFGRLLPWIRENVIRIQGNNQQRSEFVLVLLHMIEVVVWALAYLLLLPGDHLGTFERATDFSVVTFTTLGYGDITLLQHDWRLLSGIESLIGVVLIGWTTALLFMVVQRSWWGMAHGH